MRVYLFRKNILLKFAVITLLFEMFFTGCADPNGTKNNNSSKRRAMELTVGAWSKGELTKKESGGTSEQWYTFTATASTQYIYVKFSTCTSLDLYLYDSNSNQIGSRFDADGGYASQTVVKSWTLDPGRNYYIKADYGVGTYWIGFTDFPAQPETVITELIKSTWTNGNITKQVDGGTGEQWFKFTATASTQYLYVKFSTCISLDIYLFDSGYNQIGNRFDADGRYASDVRNTLWSLVPGKTYYVKADYGVGTYWIGFTDFPAQPETVVTQLNDNTWQNGNIAKQVDGGTGEQWFKFNPSTSTEYVYIKLSTSTSLDVYLYDCYYNLIGSRFDADGSSGDIKKASWNLSNGQTHYIKVDNGVGSFWITVNSTGIAPTL